MTAKKTTPKPPDDSKIKELQGQVTELNKQIKALKKKPDAKSEVDYISQIQALSEEKQKLKAQLKVAVKQHGLFKAVMCEMESHISPMSALPPALKVAHTGTVEEHLVVHLSDLHADERVEPHQVGGLERFDFNVACCRAEKYVETIIDWTKYTLAKHRFPVLHILAYGDNSSGEIHGSISRSEFGNQFKNCFAIGQLMSMMYRDLAQHFEQVKIYCVSGNHGRRSIKKDYHGAHDNWDYMIYETSRLYCRDLENVEFLIPNCFSMNININGFGFGLQHGDDIKSWNSIPFYGIERKTRRMVALQHSMGQKIDYFVMGHFHAATMSADLKGETIINGAFPATNPYSYESFSGYREPIQIIHGVHKDYGISWRLPVKIKDSAAEAKGPKRYRIEAPESAIIQPFDAGITGYSPKNT